MPSAEWEYEPKRSSSGLIRIAEQLYKYVADTCRIKIETDLMCKLAWIWPVPETFASCPLRGVLWCAALERNAISSDELELATKFLETARQRDDARVYDPTAKE